MTNWKKSKKRIGGMLAIENEVTEEICISGEYGEVWPTGEGRYACFVRSDTGKGKKVSKLLKSYFDGGLSDGSEVLFEFDESKLQDIIELLEIKPNRTKMIRLSSSL